MRFSLLFSSLAAAALLAACPTDDVECESSGECDLADICEDGVCVPNEGVDPDTPQPSTPVPEDGGSSDDGGQATERPVVVVAWNADGATHADGIEFAFSIENAESCSAAFGQNGADFHTALVNADSNGIALYNLDVAVLDALVTGPIVGSVTCDNGAGSTTAEDTFEFIADFVTGTFAANAENVATGDTVTLTATFENASTCRLTGPDLDETLTPSTGIVRDTDQALYGTIEVAHDVVVDDDITVQLNCSGARGSDSQSIELRAGGIAAFDVNPAVLIGDEPVFDFTFDVDADACNIDGNNLDLGFNTRDLPYSTNETAVLTCTLGDATFTAETDVAVLSAAELNAPGPIPHDGSITLAAQLYTVGPLPDDIACGVRRPDGTITLLAGNLRNPTPVTNVTEPGTYELLCDNDTDFTDVATPLATVDVVRAVAITSFDLVFDGFGESSGFPSDDGVSEPCDEPMIAWASSGAEACLIGGIGGSLFVSGSDSASRLDDGANELVLTCTGPAGDSDEERLKVWHGDVDATNWSDFASFQPSIVVGNVSPENNQLPNSVRSVCGTVNLTEASGSGQLRLASAVNLPDGATEYELSHLEIGRVYLSPSETVESHLSLPVAVEVQVHVGSFGGVPGFTLSGQQLSKLSMNLYGETNFDPALLPQSVSRLYVNQGIGFGSSGPVVYERTFDEAVYRFSNIEFMVDLNITTNSNTDVIVEDSGGFIFGAVFEGQSARKISFVNTNVPGIALSQTELFWLEISGNQALSLLSWDNLNSISGVGVMYENPNLPCSVGSAMSTALASGAEHAWVVATEPPDCSAD